MHDVIIIGSGIVGLATALRLKQSKPSLSIKILEKEGKIALHQTGNNSGVIHSGLYYKPGSLKMTNCINGYNKLIAFCKQEEIPFDLCGKIVVATSTAEEQYLKTLFQRGIDNGLERLKYLSKEELLEYEPHVNGTAGIFVPQTGIVNFKKVAQKYLEKFQGQGGEIAFNQKVVDIRLQASHAEVITENSTYQSRLIINCAGLYSDKIARMTMPHINFKIIPFRGEYYELAKDKEYLVKNLIYPVPDPNFPFLGVHFTRMIEGGIEAGPNAVLAFKREGYKLTDFDAKEFAEIISWPGFQKVASKYWKTGLEEIYRSISKAAFTRALQKLMPELTEKDLKPGGAGVRAQACDNDGGLIDDFLILEDKRIVNVCNAPSPAATSSLSIGDTIAQLALKRF